MDIYLSTILYAGLLYLCVCSHHHHRPPPFYAQELLPDFFTDERVELIRDVFSDLDTNSDTAIDLVEIEPFFQYALAYALDVSTYLVASYILSIP